MSFKIKPPKPKKVKLEEYLERNGDHVHHIKCINISLIKNGFIQQHYELHFENKNGHFFRLRYVCDLGQFVFQENNCYIVQLNNYNKEIYEESESWPWYAPAGLSKGNTPVTIPKKHIIYYEGEIYKVFACTTTGEKYENMDMLYVKQQYYL